MPELPGIDITTDELERRIAAVVPGSSLQRVAEELGGPPFEAPRREEPVASWRFRLPDGTYDVYRARFDDHQRLVEGMVIPRAGS